MGEIFLYLSLIVGGDMYEPRVYVNGSEVECKLRAAEATREAHYIASLTGEEVRFVAECVDADTLAKKYGIKAA